MKLPALILALALPACTVMHGNRTKGTFTYASFGGDAKALTISDKEATAGEINNSKAALSAIRTVGTIATTSIVNDMLSNASNNATATELGNQATTRSIAAGKEATKQLSITEATKGAAIKAATQ